jgi:hypothetical protein
MATRNPPPPPCLPLTPTLALGPDDAVCPSQAGLQARNAALETVLEAQRRPAAAAKPRSSAAKDCQQTTAPGSLKSHAEDDMEVLTAG